MSRDKTIDRLRALAIFQVLVVHVLYWGEFFTNKDINLLKSFFLFEMPLFFFITGASNSFSNTKNYCGFVAKRFTRILIPYYIFAVICIILSIAKYILEGNFKFLLGFKVIVSWLIPINKQLTSVSYLTWALWFIPVYLSLVLFIPALKKLYLSKYKILYAILLLSIFIITCGLKLGWIQNVAFYAFWIYIGLFYYDIKSVVKQKRFRIGAVYIIGVGITAVILCRLVGRTFNMQTNKFPPNLMFFAFSLVVMGIIVVCIPIIDWTMEHIERINVFGKLIDLYSKKSMTIFLYQVFVFKITIRLAKLTFHSGSVVQEICQAFFCLIITIFLCAITAMLFGKFENIGDKTFNKLEELVKIYCDKHNM